MSENPLLIILGATASGKTKLAVQVAKELNGEIISADSRQVFKDMDIGTGKDLGEYLVGDQIISHHLINILEPGERYHVDAFKNDFYAAFESIILKQKLPVLCGGTGMYIHSLLQNQNYTAVPVQAELRLQLDFLSKEELIAELKEYPSDITKHVDVSSKKRLIRAIEIAEYLKNNELKIEEKPNLNPLIFGLKNQVEITRSNILRRLSYRLKNGMIEEVEHLLSMGIKRETLVFYGLEYKFIANYLSGDFNYKDLELKLGIAICQYAKRQNTFFRKMEKDGVNIHWLDAAWPLNFLKDEVIQLYKEF